ncbi:splicing factor SF3a60 protein [Trifolium repens]|nr:splicing factor SF3a60 protein [Trifolium repens]
MIDTITSTTERLVEIYDDQDNARKDEISALGGQTATGINVFSAFYDRLKEIREYHRKHPVARVVDANDDFEALLKEEPQIEFSGEALACRIHGYIEFGNSSTVFMNCGNRSLRFLGLPQIRLEAFGRYLDMHELYQQYVNSKFGEPIEYSAYLDIFSETDKIPRKMKTTRQYREYLENLLEYLIYFFQRTEPLKDLDRIFSKVTTEFEENWATGKVLGWENVNQENGHVPTQHTAIDLDYYSTVEELMEVGPERLKEALAALGLKTGGTVQQRAERLFLTKHTPLEKLDKKHFAKGTRGLEKNGVVSTPQEGNLKEIALMEAKLYKLCDLLDEAIVRTKDNVVKKQALTYEEIVAEQEEEEAQEDSESEDDEQQIYNPLKLPMGWDGKPIPYWLYKLHGLGQEFKCEICGNYSYWGRRAFERHFKEWRHQHGMRCLGIPNTKNFNEITSIEEAKELWKKIQQRQGVNKWRPDLEEEYEDKEGNIYNKKTYTDLQRQGLI